MSEFGTITEKTKELARENGKTLNAGQQKFLDVVHAALNDMNPNWQAATLDRKGDMLEEAQTQLRDVYVVEGHLAQRTFENYIGFTYIAVKFEVPWRLAAYVPVRDLNEAHGRARHMRKGTMPERMERALDDIRRERDYEAKQAEEARVQTEVRRRTETIAVSGSVPIRTGITPARTGSVQPTEVKPVVPKGPVFTTIMIPDVSSYPKTPKGRRDAWKDLMQSVKDVLTASETVECFSEQPYRNGLTKLTNHVVQAYRMDPATAVKS